MNCTLSPDKRKALLLQHKAELTHKSADRIKAVLLSDGGMSNREIARVLFLNEETIARHIADYVKKSKLANASGGSKPKLNEAQSASLISHINTKVYADASKICAYVESQYGVKYSSSGMVSWLHYNGFSYKSPARIPAKADKGKQAEFVQKYEDLKSNLPDDAVILFGDGVHPSMQTKLSHGWIATGKAKSLQTTASRTRLNLFGAIELESMAVTHAHYDTINSESMCDFLERVKLSYPKGPIHLILDQGPYNRSRATQEKAKLLGIEIHLLPPYSPNLNAIERLWRVMNEATRNNVYFKSSKDFKKAILSFFTERWHLIKEEMRSSMNDNFRTLKFDTLI